MKEEKWLTTTDLHTLLAFVWDRITERKLRLLACGITRQFWDELTDPRSRAAIETAEAHADRRVTPEQLAVAALNAEQAAVELRENLTGSMRMRRANRPGNRKMIDNLLDQVGPAELAIDASRVYLPQFFENAVLGQNGSAWEDLVRDVFGNPFRQVSVNPAWLRWKDGTVGKLAASIYEAHDFAYLPVLADALEEAGCTDTELLSHCRGTPRHIRGCWALDLLTSKEASRQPRTQVLRDQRPQTYWTLRQSVEVTGRYVRQTSSHDHYAWLQLRLAQSNEKEAIVLVNELDEEQLDPRDRPYLPTFLLAITKGVYDRLRELEQWGVPIAGLSIVLTSIRIHPVDSSPRAFQAAASEAILNAYTDGHWLEVSEAR